MDRRKHCLSRSGYYMQEPVDLGPHRSRPTYLVVIRELDSCVGYIYVSRNMCIEIKCYMDVLFTHFYFHVNLSIYVCMYVYHHHHYIRIIFT